MPGQRTQALTHLEGWELEALPPTRIKAGTPTDLDFFGIPRDGFSVWDTVNKITWTRDGGKWMSPIIPAELHPLDQLSGVSSTQSIYATLPALFGGVYLLNAYVTHIVTGTNNGTNFWTMQLSSKSSPNTDTNRGASINTSALAASTYTQVPIALGITIAATTEFSLRLNATVTLTPGPLYMQCVVFYRFIAP